MCRKGQEEDGEWRRMGHRHRGKNPWKVCRALLLMKLVQLQRGHKSKTVHECTGTVHNMNGTFLYVHG